MIDSCCGRGSTILQGQGGYRCDNKQVVMCVCNNKEMYLLQHAVKEADPASFMIILESNEVHGEGFRTIRIGEYQETSSIFLCASLDRLSSRGKLSSIISHTLSKSRSVSVSKLCMFSLPADSFLLTFIP